MGGASWLRRVRPTGRRGLFTDLGSRLARAEVIFLSSHELFGIGWAGLGQHLADLNISPTRPWLLLSDKLMQLGEPLGLRAASDSLRASGCRTVALVPGLGEWGCAGEVRRLAPGDVLPPCLALPPSDDVATALVLLLNSVFDNRSACRSGPTTRIPTALRLLLGLAHRVLHRHPNYAQELADAFDYVIPIPLTAADAPAAPQQLLVAVREGLDIYDPTAPGGVGGLTEDWERSLRASLMDHAAELRALQVERGAVAAGLEAELRRILCAEATASSLEGPQAQLPTNIHIAGLEPDAVLAAAATQARRAGLQDAWNDGMSKLCGGSDLANLRVQVWSRLDAPVGESLLGLLGRRVSFTLGALHVGDDALAVAVSLPGVPLPPGVRPFICFGTAHSVLPMDCAALLSRDVDTVEAEIHHHGGTDADKLEIAKAHVAAFPMPMHVLVMQVSRADLRPQGQGRLHMGAFFLGGLHHDLDAHDRELLCAVASPAASALFGTGGRATKVLQLLAA
eukprot:jgi/Tetstr1/438083/TSEL_026707.t1